MSRHTKASDYKTDLWGKATPYPNGDVDCPLKGKRIDRVICAIQWGRDAAACEASDCPRAKK